MELKIKKVEIFEVEYNDLNRFINHHFFDGEPMYEFVADHELSNYVSKDFDINGEVSEGDLNDIKDGVMGFMARTYLNESCRRGLIPKGKYLIKVFW